MPYLGAICRPFISTAHKTRLPRRTRRAKARPPSLDCTPRAALREGRWANLGEA
jgi:hypothetical protein